MEKYVHGIIMVGAGIAGLAGLRAAIAAAEVSNSARFSKVSIYTSCKHFNNGKHGKTIKASQNLGLLKTRRTYGKVVRLSKT